MSKYKMEEKKMFTKSDLRNGDVVLRRNGNVEILVLPLGTLITQSGGFNRINELKDDLTDSNFDKFDIVAVRRPTEDWHCTFNAFKSKHGTLVYNRECDTKKLYNGKVVCIDNRCNKGGYTVGKIYQFVDGKITLDNGDTLPFHDKIYCFEDWVKYSNSKFIEVVE